MAMVLVMNIYAIGKEVVQISQQVLGCYAGAIISHKAGAYKSAHSLQHQA